MIVNTSFEDLLKSLEQAIKDQVWWRAERIARIIAEECLKLEDKQ